MFLNINLNNQIIKKYLYKSNLVKILNSTILLKL